MDFDQRTETGFFFIEKGSGRGPGHDKYAALRLYDRALTASEVMVLAAEFA